MPYICHSHEFIFFAAPATGSTSVITALQAIEVGEYLPAENIHRDGEMLVARKHGTLAQLRAAGLMLPQYESYAKISGIRNPFSWHVAKFLRDKHKRARQAKSPKSWIAKLPDAQRERYIKRLEVIEGMDFGQYLRFQLRKKEPFEVQAAFHESADHFVHQERLADDARKIFAELGVERPVQIEEVNVTGAMDQGKTYKDFYDPKSIDLVYTMNAPFFKRFPEYSFDGLRD